MTNLIDKNKGAYKLNNFGPIYCINLDGQPERWHYMEDQFKYWQLTDYERVSAYDGREDDLGDIIKGKYPDGMSSGEIIFSISGVVRKYAIARVAESDARSRPKDDQESM